jgi:HlyD family secretion protein
MKHKKTVIAVIVLGLSVAAVVMYLRKSSGQPVSYRTAAITRSDLLVSINATGTVEPEEVIDVGAQIAGQILKFGQDKAGKTIDYGSVVEAGMILAQIDDSLYAADAAQATALVQVNKASLQSAEANLEQLKAKLYQAQRDWERAQKLGPSEALAVTSYDAY